uniref:Uncharacterized protein n=1 Tax=Timema tahoe TaxID=61484 RepID=A0A7R9II97_9NEOP|nr:unnamed protein product [Timema tahoe]
MEFRLPTGQDNQLFGKLEENFLSRNIRNVVRKDARVRLQVSHKQNDLPNYIFNMLYFTVVSELLFLPSSRSSSPTLILPAHQAGSQLARPCFKLVGFGPDQPSVVRLHLTWLPLGFYPTSTKLFRPRGTPFGDHISLRALSLSHLDSRACERCISTLRNYSDGSALDHLFCFSFLAASAAASAFSASAKEDYREKNKRAKRSQDGLDAKWTEMLERHMERSHDYAKVCPGKGQHQSALQKITQPDGLITQTTDVKSKRKELANGGIQIPPQDEEQQEVEDIEVLQTHHPPPEYPVVDPEDIEPEDIDKEDNDFEHTLEEESIIETDLSTITNEGTDATASEWSPGMLSSTVRVVSLFSTEWYLEQERVLVILTATSNINIEPINPGERTRVCQVNRDNSIEKSRLLPRGQRQGRLTGW